MSAALPSPEAPASEPAFAPIGRARTALAKRLADIVCLPTTRVTPQERHLAADLLVEMLRESGTSLRERCARRVAALSDAPQIVVRYLARDLIEIARPILTQSEALSDSDLVATARAGGLEHRLLIAERREVRELVVDALLESAEPAVSEALLRNKGAELSQAALELMINQSQEHAAFCALLSRRPELRPSQGLTLFWWSDAETRRALLRRFAIERAILQEAASDLFAFAAEEGWADPLARKALQFIERRQRNRAALAKSPFASLEAAIEAAARDGFSRRMVEEISHLAGIKPATGAQVLADLGGEPVAVLCKAAGVKRPDFLRLWGALRRVSQEAVDPAKEAALIAYDSLSADKAQTVLRYWNWSLTSAFAPALARALEAQGEALDEFSAAQRSARLVFGRRG